MHYRVRKVRSAELNRITEREDYGGGGSSFQSADRLNNSLYYIKKTHHL